VQVTRYCQSESSPYAANSPSDGADATGGLLTGGSLTERDGEEGTTVTKAAVDTYNIK